jgi:hypothetical protein
MSYAMYKQVFDDGDCSNGVKIKLIGHINDDIKLLEAQISSLLDLHVKIVDSQSASPE